MTAIATLSGTAADVIGQSTDGAFFSQTNSGTNVAGAAGTGSSSGGSFILGSSLANSGLTATIQTLAGAQAAAGATAAAFSSAALTDQISFASPGAQGSLVITLDPFMLDMGAALSTVTYVALLDGAPVFFASATLDGFGDLTVSGSLSTADFVVSTIGGTSTATLVNTIFAVPITISAVQTGQQLAFEFDQAYYASAQDGGLSISATPVPEPLPLAVLAGAGIALLASRSLRRQA